MAAPPLRRKKVIIIQHPPAPLTGSGSYFCLSSRFWELVLSLISSTAVFLCIEIRFLRLLNVFLGAFSASESVSEFLDAVLSFFTAVCVQFLLFEIIIVARPPPPEKKKVIIIGRPPLRRKKVIIIQHPPAPLTGSGSYFCLSSRFRDLVLPLISSTAAFFVSWNSFSAATKCVSGRLFCQWIGLRASGRRFVFLHSRLWLVALPLALDTSPSPLHGACDREG